MERLSPVHWAVKQMRQYYVESNKGSWYPPNWEQLAEDAGYFFHMNEFHGDYNKLEKEILLAQKMFGSNNVFFEVGNGHLFMVFDSAVDAFRFRFELAECS